LPDAMQKQIATVIGDNKALNVKQYQKMVKDGKIKERRST